MTPRRSSRYFSAERRQYRPLPVVLPVLAGVIAVASWVNGYVAAGQEAYVQTPLPSSSGPVSSAAPYFNVAAWQIEGTHEQPGVARSGPPSSNESSGRPAAHAATPVIGLDGKRNFYVRSWDLPCKPACAEPAVREFTVTIPLPDISSKGWR